MFGKKTVISTRFNSVFVASMVSMVSSYVLALTDNIVAGQIIGDSAVAAMTLVFPIYTLLLFVSYVVSDGLVMMISYAQGRNDREEINRLFSLGMILSIDCAIFFFAALVLFKDQILSFWEISEQLKAYSVAYYDGLKFFPLVMFVNIFIYTVFMTEGKENACIISSATSFMVNIALDIILCQNMGIKGIGLATMFSMLASLITQIYFLTGGRSQLRFSWYWDLKKILKGIYFSFYHSIDTLFISILPVLLSMGVIRFFGEDELIVVTVAVNLLTLVIAIYGGLVDCLQPMVCQYHAENNFYSMKKTMDLGIKVTIILSVAMTFLGMIFADFLPMLFGVEEAALEEEAVTAMRFLLPFIIFLGCVLIYSNYYVYIEEMRLSALVKLILFLVMPCIGMEIGGKISMNAFWLCVGASFAVSFAANFIVTKFFGKRGGLLLLDKNILNKQLSYDVDTVFEDIIALTKKVDADLLRLGVDDKTRNKLVLFTEEFGLHAVERAGDKIFQLEFSFLIDDDAYRVIIRDNGTPYDILAIAEEKKFSFREFFIDSITERVVSRNYVESGDENRVVIRI